MSQLYNAFLESYNHTNPFEQKLTKSEIVCPNCKYEKAVMKHWSSCGTAGFRDPSETSIHCPKCGYEVEY